MARNQKASRELTAEQKREIHKLFHQGERSRPYIAWLLGLSVHRVRSALLWQRRGRRGPNRLGREGEAYSVTLRRCRVRERSGRSGGRPTCMAANSNGAQNPSKGNT